jgi:ATP-dependent helicase/DNAse subunit B
LEATDPVAEVEAVARQIKTDLLAGQTASDLAVVVPNAAYTALIRETFDRVGVSLQDDRPRMLSTSRPARLVTSALDLVRGQWRHDLLLDFLHHPAVQRRLEQSHRLRDGFDHRPRLRRPLTPALWQESWQRYVRGLREHIRRLETDKAAPPEHLAGDRDQHLGRLREAADGLDALIASLETILQPVAALDQLMHAPTRVRLASVVDAVIDLLNELRVLEWMGVTPTPGISWREYHADQRAYECLLEVLQALAALPGERVPLTAGKRPDVVAALRLALEAETFTVADEDGVQLLELQDVPGLRFRRVYVLGMNQGVMPPALGDGSLRPKRFQVAALRAQRAQREAEIRYEFAQVLQSARDAVVLVRSTQAEDGDALPSELWAALETESELPVPAPPAVLVCPREAACRLGRAYATSQPWSTQGELDSVRVALEAWRARPNFPQEVHIDAPALLRLRFPDARHFTPSDLETYAACPFRYFGLNVLRLQERDPDRTRALYGSLVHRVLRRFYDKRRRTFNGPVGQPLPATAPADRADLVQLFAEEWDQVDDGTLPPDLQTVFAHERGVLGLLLEAIAEIERDHGNLLNEFTLLDSDNKPVRLGVDREGRPVYLTAQIDRVDVHREAITKAVILDYKTGKALPAREVEEKVADGRMLQLPLYGCLLQEVAPKLEVVGGAYVHLSERQRHARDAVLSSGDWLDRPRSAPFDPEATRRLALDMVSDIRSGNFSLTRHADGPHGECTEFCTLRHACRQPDGYRNRLS